MLISVASSLKKLAILILLLFLSVLSFKRDTYEVTDYKLTLTASHCCMRPGGV